jgi:hypothetical protein
MLINSYSWFIWFGIVCYAYLRRNHAHKLRLMVNLVWHRLLWLPKAESCSLTPTQGLFGLAMFTLVT